MSDWTAIIDLAQTAPFIAVFYFLWKSGAINIGNGKKNGTQAQIDELKKHASTANSEMSIIKDHISDIKEELGYIKGLLNNKHGRD